MAEPGAKRLILPTFILTSTCDADAQGALRRTIYQSSTATPFAYRFQPLHLASKQAGDTNFSYKLMPIVVDKSGAPWAEANLYLLARLEGVHNPNMTTFAAIAADLAAFKRFLEEEDIDYRMFPQKKLFRPTYRYRAELQLRIRAAEIAPTTARRRMTAVIGFYRWLVEEGLVKPGYPLWQEGDIYFQFTDSKGFHRTKLVKTTDIAVRLAKQNDPYDGTIDDGGKLRPLTEPEQIWLLEALIELGNIEMTLIHLLALFTGARIQTVLTFRIRHVLSEPPDDVAEIRIPAGLGTTIDTKNDKQLVLMLPIWLYEKLRVYAFSDRAKKRRNKAGDHSEDQYLFLSNRGRSMYRSKADRQQFDVTNSSRHEIEGQAVRQFMAERVIPLIKKKSGGKFRYRFHDLRATYGMNLTDQQLMLVQEGKARLSQVREFVKVRMGHESSATTDLYLNYRQNMKFVAQIQFEYEGHLKTLADTAKRIAI